MIPLEEDAALLERASGKEVAGQPRWMYKNPHELVPLLASTLRDRSAAIREAVEIIDAGLDVALHVGDPLTAARLRPIRAALLGSETK